MSRRHFDGRRRSRRRRGPIKRVTRGLADAFGVPRGVIIAGFVLGFVFIPLLTLVAFLAALHWVNDPERARRQVDSFFESLRRAGVRFRRGAKRPGAGYGDGDGDAEPGRQSHEPPRPRRSPPRTGTTIRKTRASGTCHRTICRLRGVPPQPRVPADGARVTLQSEASASLPAPGREPSHRPDNFRTSA